MRTPRHIISFLLALDIALMGSVARSDIDQATRITVAEHLSDLIESFDADEDGQLSLLERVDLEDHIAKRHGEVWVPPASEVLDEADTNGDNTVTEQEWKI